MYIMPFEPRFWEDKFWRGIGERVWTLLEYARHSLDVLKGDESEEYIKASALISKTIVEKISEEFELSEPEIPELSGADAVTEYMKLLAEMAIGRDEAITLAWTLRFITLEYLYASYPVLKAKPELADELLGRLGSDLVYDPPSMFKTSDIDLTIYAFKGYLDNINVTADIVREGGEKFRYKLVIRDKEADPEKQSLGSLLVKLGLLSWYIMAARPGLLTIYRTTDVRGVYLDRAGTRVPSAARDLVDEVGVVFLGDGSPFTFFREYIGEKGAHIIEFTSEQYKPSFPVPKACKESVYVVHGGIIRRRNLCVEANITLSKVNYILGEESEWKTSAVEFLRGLSPYIFLGVVEVVRLQNDEWILITRV